MGEETTSVMSIKTQNKPSKVKKKNKLESELSHGSKTEGEIKIRGRQTIN